MSETAKEKIKRKKKEREQALLEESLKPAEAPKAEISQEIEPDLNCGQVEKAQPPEAKKQGVEVLEIYPIRKPKAKFLVQGTITIKMHDIGLKVRNIWYSILPSHDVRVQAPFRYYRFPDEPEKPDAYVESITFDDKAIWKNASKIIREFVLEHHREELLKTADSQEK